MMRTTVIIFLGLLLLGTPYACSNGDFKQTRAEMLERKQQRKLEYEAKKEAEEAEKAKMEAEAMAKAKIEAEKAANEAAPVTIIRYVEDSLLLEFDRRPCFGRCPVYKIKVYESGFTIYEGINFVDQIGYYQSELSNTQLAEIYAMIAKADFFELENKYDDEKIMDLPSMIFRVRAMGQDKRVIARYDIPEALQEFARSIDNLFKETVWQPSAPR